MNSPLLNPEIQFPPRLSTHKGRWAPIYLEPVVGSGEQLCIGVVASDEKGSVVESVPGLERLSCIYGKSSEALCWSAKLAIAEVQSAVASGGLGQLGGLSHRIDGLRFGEIRVGAAQGLSELARNALRQVSSLAAADWSMEEPSVPVEQMAPGNIRLVSQVRLVVLRERPEWRDRFGTVFQRGQPSRPVRFGFVGRRFVANFASLTAEHLGSLTNQVDKAKARLWDLHQLQEGVLSDSLLQTDGTRTFELLVHRPRRNGNWPAQSKRTIDEAETELEAEADKFQIMYRPLPTPAAIGRFLLDREAA